MANLGWHDYLVFASFIACILGLSLIFNAYQNPSGEVEAADRMLLLMSFTYWMVYCVAIGGQKIVLADWEVVILSLKFTAIISYFLTFTCILGLPLHHLAMSRRVQG